MFRNADVEKTQAPRADKDLDYQLKQRLDAQRCDAMSTSPGGQLGRAMTDEEIVAEFFKYHAPTEFTIPKFAAINQAAKNLAEVIMSNCPRGWDRRDAINAVRQARMIANAAIALEGLSLP